MYFSKLRNLSEMYRTDWTPNPPSPSKHSSCYDMMKMTILIILVVKMVKARVSKRMIDSNSILALKRTCHGCFCTKLFGGKMKKRKALQIDIKSFSSEFMFVKKAVAGKYESFSCYISITLPWNVFFIKVFV